MTCVSHLVRLVAIHLLSGVENCLRCDSSGTAPGEWRAGRRLFSGFAWLPPLGRTHRLAIAPGLHRGRRRIPLRYDQFKQTFKIGTAAVVAMVVLRLALGCHFFYEGVWKITHPEFSAESYLTAAKGPFAWVFHAMVPDMDGRGRLAVEPCVRIQGSEDGNDLRAAWEKLQRDAVVRYERGLTDAAKKELKGKLTAKKQAEIEAQVADFRVQTELILFEALDGLDRFVDQKQAAILAYFSDANRASSGEVPDTVANWFAELAKVEKQYLDGLAGKIAEATGAKKPPALAATVPVIDKKVKLEQVVKNTIVRSPGGRELFRAENAIEGSAYTDTFSSIQKNVERSYRLTDEERRGVAKACRRYRDSVRMYLDENQQDIVAHFASTDRLAERQRVGSNSAAHAKKRAWDEKQELQAEVDGWLGELDAMQEAYLTTAWNVLNEEVNRPGNDQKLRPVSAPWTLMDLIDFAVTYGLTAIGLCLLLGLFTRPAALGGAVFMLFVVLTQPGWPTIYPPAPPVVGHSLLVNKDFIEMLALCVMVTTAVGRWAGLDYFVETYVIHLYEQLRDKYWNPAE